MRKNRFQNEIYQDGVATFERSAKKKKRKTGRTVTIVIIVAALLIGSVSFAFHALEVELFGNDIDLENLPSVSDITFEDLPDPVREPLVAGGDDHSVNGAWLTPTVDFLLPEVSLEGNKAATDALVEGAAELGFCTVIVAANVNGKTIFPSEVFEAFEGFAGLLEHVTEAAQQHELRVYISIDVQQLREEPIDFTNFRDVALVNLAVREIITNFRAEGVILSGLYYQELDFARYLRYGGGMGFENFLRQGLNEAMLMFARTVRESAPGMRLGLQTDAVWATTVTHTNGFETENDLETSYNTKLADTLAWVNDDIFNFVLVDAKTSLNDNILPFLSVAQWWAANIENEDVDVFINHAASRVGENSPGWNNPDQLSRQLMALQDTPNVTGSFFDSMKSLADDQTGSTNALTRYLAGSLAVQYIINELAITFPTRNNFSQYEDLVNFRGSSDPNFPLLMNGEEVEERTENGRFTIDVQLSVGANTITFEHKGRTLTYEVTHRVPILRDVSPSENLTVDAGSTISVGVLARRGATVTASFNGQTVNLRSHDDSNSEMLPEYHQTHIIFRAEIVLPNSETNRDLGRVTFVGSYRGISETRHSANVTILGRPATPPPPPTPPSAGVSGGSGGSDGPNFISVGNTHIAEVIVDQAETLSGTVLDHYSRANHFPLPRGTLDYVASSDAVFMSPGASPQHFRVMRNGRRVHTRNANQGDVIRIMQGTLPETNTVTALRTNVSQRHTDLVFRKDWPAPFNINLAPQNFSNPNNTAGRPTFAITAQTATHLDITFYYAESGQGAVNVANSRVFSRAEWVSTSDTVVLRLHLRRAGMFFGYRAFYNADRTELTFSFNHPAQVNVASGRMNGVEIIIDPGHGGQQPGALSPVPGIHESHTVLTLSNEITELLRARGATVHQTRTADTHLTLEQRAAMTRARRPDAFISVHRNASNNSAAHGYEIYYYNQFSFNLARHINTTVAPLYRAQRGVLWFPFYVTRPTEAPSVLSEAGFISNAQDFEQMMNPAHRARVAQAHVDGIWNYIVSTQ